MFINDIIHLFTAIYEMHICNAFIKKKNQFTFLLQYQH